jgi:hypothetical protein
MTRSMTLIKIYFVNTIKATGQEVSRKLAERVCSIHWHTLMKGTIRNRYPSFDIYQIRYTLPIYTPTGRGTRTSIFR